MYSLSLRNKTVTSKLVNTGSFVWTEDEVRLLVRIEKGEQHKQNFKLLLIVVLLLVQKNPLTAGALQGFP